MIIIYNLCGPREMAINSGYLTQLKLLINSAGINGLLILSDYLYMHGTA